MTSDDQYFLDLLSSIPQDVAKYGNVVADFIERQVDTLATEIKGWGDKLDATIATSTRQSRAWQPPPPPKSLLQQTGDWVSEHRTAVAVTVAFTGTLIFLYQPHRRLARRKRRAKRTVTGAKKEIVIIASTSHDPLARSLALDLDRRGYIIYMTVSSQGEYDLLERGPDARADIRPLWMDMTSSVPDPAKDIHPMLNPIRNLISKPQTHQRPGFPNQQYMCTLAGLILMPPTDYTRSPLISHPTHDLIDTVNTRLLSPMITIQQFLPLLNHLPNPSSIIVAFPSIPTTLTPPLQIASAATTSALSAMTRSLRSELHLLQPANAQPIQVTELRLGNIDLGTTPTFSKSQNADVLDSLSHSHSPSPSRSPQAALPWHWHSSQRAQLLRRTFGQGTNTSVRGSSVRVFHDAVFDVLYASRSLKASADKTWSRAVLDNVILALTPHGPDGIGIGPGGIVYAGRGAHIYTFLAAILPEFVIQPIMRWRCRREGWGIAQANQHPSHVDLEAGSSASHATGSVGGGSPGLDASVGGGNESAIWEKV